MFTRCWCPALIVWQLVKQIIKWVIATWFMLLACIWEVHPKLLVCNSLVWLDKWGWVKKSISYTWLNVHWPSLGAIHFSHFGNTLPADTGKWMVLDFIFICHLLFVIVMLKGHSVSLPLGLLWLEQLLKQKLTWGIHNGLVNNFYPQKDKACEKNQK